MAAKKVIPVAKFCEGCGAKLSAKACPCGYKRSINSPKDMAVVGLLVNAGLLPGLGTIIGGDHKTGVKQLVLFLIGIPLCLIIVGLFILFGVWIWSIFTSINQIRSLG